MLEIKKIRKVYETEGLKQVALNNVSINFRENDRIVFICNYFDMYDSIIKRTNYEILNRDQKF